MCGIVGLIGGIARNEQRADGAVRQMAARLKHRGPDQDGFCVHAAAGVALGDWLYRTYRRMAASL